MGRKRRNNDFDSRKKRYKIASGIIDPGTSGVYATCPRNKEKRCIEELMSLFEEKIEEYGIVAEDEKEKEEAKEKDEKEEKEETKEKVEGKDHENTFEDDLQAELEALKNPNKQDKKKSLLEPIQLNQECVVYIKMRKPIDPEKFIHRVITDIFNGKQKRTRYTQKLSPVQSSCNATMEEFEKCCRKVLQRHFHEEKDQRKGIKYATHVNRRNFNTIDKMDLIKKVGECMGRDQEHIVDLKTYEKLVLVECFKNNIGLSVVDDHLKFSRYNLDQMFESSEGKSS